MFELEKERVESDYSPRWQIGIDRRQVIVYICLALVGGFAFGFATAKYTTTKESLAAVPASRTEATKSAAASEAPPEGFVRVTRLLRGDTIEVDGVGAVRMIGIETPDGKAPSEVYGAHGQQSLAFAEKTLLNQDVRLELDPAYADGQNKDGKGQTLAYVYTRDGLLVNAEMIKRGYAMVQATEQFRLIDDFRSYERDAMQAMRGVWGLDTSSSSVASAQTPPATGTTADGKARKLNPMNPSEIGPNLPALSGSSGATPASTSTEAMVLTSSADRMYHKSGCEYLGKKKVPMALSQARSSGYTACGRCYPSTTLKAP
ncbi:MAG TPA: thermonuclease family protein [Blastocatellia bacterium]|nr:thermonuclease family protein [Blastocatellia bacterium]